MTTQQDLERMYIKFDKDIVKRSRFFRFLLAVDQLFNAVLWNGSQDETISSHIYRKQQQGTSSKLEDSICWVLKKLESSHCFKSRGE